MLGALQLGALPLNLAHNPDFFKLLHALRWHSASCCPSGHHPTLLSCAVLCVSQLGALPLNFAHDPDFYKLLRAVRWYSASSCPSGNNSSSSSYWSPPGAMEAAAAAAEVPAELIADTTETAEGGAGTTGLPVDYFGPTAAAPGADYFGGYGAPAAAAAAPAAAGAVARFQAPSPSKVPPVDNTASRAPGSSKGMFGSRAGKGFPASSWLKNLHLPGKSKSKAASLTATTALATGGFSPLSAAAGAGVGSGSQLPISSSAVEYLPVTTGLPSGSAGAVTAAAGGGEDRTAAGGAPQSRSNSRASSISLAAGGKQSVHHSPAASEGSSVVARTAAAEIARNAVAAVIERATREEEAEIQVFGRGEGAVSRGGPSFGSMSFEAGFVCSTTA